MAEARDRQLRIVAVVDEASFNQARNILTQFTKEMETAIASAHRLQTTMGGGGGGTGPAPNLSSGVMATGGLTPQSAVMGASAAASVGVRPANAMTDALLASTNLFKNAASMGRDSARVMGDALKSSVDQQVRDIERLRSSIDQLGKTYERLSSQRDAGMDINSNHFQNVQNIMVNRMQKLSSAQDNLAQLRQMQAEHAPPPPITSGNFVGGGPGYAQGMLARGNMPTFLSSPFMGGQEPTMGNVLGRLGRLGGIAMGGAGAIAGMYSQEPQIYMRLQHRLGAQYGGEAMRMLQGDVSLAATVRQLSGTEQADIARMLGGGQQLAERIKAFPQGLVNTLMGGGGAGVLEGETAAELGIQQKEQVLNYLRQKRESDPLAMRFYGMFQQQLGGRMAGARALGMSPNAAAEGSYGYMINTRTGRRLPAEIARAEALHPGAAAEQGYDLGYAGGTGGLYDPNERGAMLQQLETIMGRRNSYGEINRVISAQYGGLRSAAGVIAAGRLGGGVRGAYDILQGNIGRSGLDVAAASGIGDVFSQAMMSGGAMTGGQGFMSAMTEAAAGLSTENQMRFARGLPGGLQGMSRVYGGGIDSYQQGRNLLSAISAAPNIGIHAQEYLADLGRDPRLMMDIINTGRVPLELQVRGITAEQVQKAFRDQQRSVWERFVSDPRDRNSTRGKFAESVRSSGYDVTKAYRGELAGLSGKARAQKSEELIASYASVLRDTGIAGSDEAATVQARIELEGIGADGKKRGGGVGDPAKRTTEAGALSEISKEQTRFNEFVKSSADELQKLYQNSAKSAQEMDKVGKLGTSLDETAAALGRLTREVNGLSSVINALQINANPSATFDNISRVKDFIGSTMDEAAFQQARNLITDPKYKAKATRLHQWALGMAQKNPKAMAKGGFDTALGEFLNQN